MGLTEGHWFENEEELTERQLEKAISDEKAAYERGFRDGSSKKEPIKPIERNGFYYCGECRYAFTVHRQKFCSDCGRPVKWSQ